MKTEIQNSESAQKDHHSTSDISMQAFLESLYCSSRREEEKVTFEKKRAEALAEWQLSERKWALHLKFTAAGAIAAFFVAMIVCYSLQMPSKVCKIAPLLTALSAYVLLLVSKKKNAILSPAFYCNGSFVVSSCNQLFLHDANLRASARESLVQNLPDFPASDSHILERTQRNALCLELLRRELAREPDYIEFQIVVLKALQRIGVARDMPIVQLLAEETVEHFDQSAVLAARECLPYLQARAKSETERTQLLRASSFTTLGTNELLRPAKGSQDKDGRTLLRSVGEEENP